jgi:hypothetical protein
MRIKGDRHRGDRHSQEISGENRRYAWKKRSYIVPNPSQKAFQFKLSALRSLHKLHKVELAGEPVTIVVPALYNLMPAETVALGWLNEIDALVTIRNKIVAANKVTGWDVYSFHTQHNLDPFYASMIDAVRETWLREGSLKLNSVAEARARFSRQYHYNSIPGRLVENIVFQSSLINWLSKRTGAPLRFHAVGTALLGALVSTAAISLDSAVRTALKAGTRWDDSIAETTADELKRMHAGKTPTEEDHGWRRFHRIRQMIEGRAEIALGVVSGDLPEVDAPTRPFWFSATAEDEPVLIESIRDVHYALESMTLSSWSPVAPKPIPTKYAADRVRGWLVSPLHPMASICRWSVYNYMLATPATALQFLDHIAVRGAAPRITPESEAVQKRLPLSRRKVTGP